MNLFQLDNFSYSEIKFIKAQIDVSMFRSILDRYFVNYKIEDVWEIKTTAIHSVNYKMMISVKGFKKNILFRKYNTLQLEQIKFYLEFLEKFSENFLSVGKVIRTRDGELMFSIGDSSYALFDFISGDYFYPNEKALSSVAQAVARMHKVFDTFKKDDIDKIGILSQRGYTYFNKIKNYSISDFESIENIIKEKEELNEEDNYVLKKIPLFIETVKEIEKENEKISNLPVGLIHSDLHPHNFLLKDNKVQAILDFDGMRVSQTARDVAFAVYRLGRQFFAQNILEQKKENGKKIADLFIKAYEKEKKITKDEKNLLPTLIKDEFIRKILFVLNGVYKESNNIWKKDLPKFLIAIDEINYFFN